MNLEKLPIKISKLNLIEYRNDKSLIFIQKTDSMKFNITHPKIWEKVCERNIPMKNKISIYEKMGGAYRLGEDKGEQVFNKLTELLKYKNSVKEASGEDHEASMAQGSLEAIIKHAKELMGKIGKEEKNLPGWIQDHISKAENFIQQANDQYHEYNGKN